MLDVIRENIEAHREEAGLSQESLSRKCHYDKTYVGKIERGDATPSLEAILRIADVLDTQPIKLFEVNVDSSTAEFSQQVDNLSSQVGELFIDVFQNSPTIFFLTSADGKILRINNTARKVLKADANGVTGRILAKLPIWSQCGMSPDDVKDLVEMGAIGKQAIRQVKLTYKGRDVTLQIQVSSASTSQQQANESNKFVVFQLFFIENTLNRTIMGDHFDLLKQ